MQEFIDPDSFANDDELLEHIIDNVVVPSLTEQVGEEALDDIQGVAYVFGGRNDVNPDILPRLQGMMEEEGVSLEYALREFTDLRVGRKRYGSRGGLHVHYIELVSSSEAIAIPSADELQDMFERSD